VSLTTTDDLLSQVPAIAAFNAIQIEHAEAIVAGAEAAGLPVILQFSENAVRYHGSLEPLGSALLAIARASTVPVAVHLDHAESEDLVQEALQLGFTSVMFDAATSPYTLNVSRTAAIVQEAARTGAWVEAELGEIGGKDGAHLDSGSLTLTIAAHFPEDRNLIVVTNNLAAVQVLSAKPRLTVMALPGRVRGLTQGAVDDWTRQRIATLKVDLAIVGANGLTSEDGVTTTNPDEAEVKRAMLESGRRRLLALTSSKIGIASFCHVADLSELDLIVTDDGADPEQISRLATAGPELAVV